MSDTGTHHRSTPPFRHALYLGALCGALLLAFVSIGVAAYDWPQFDGGPQHTGNNPQETAITPANVAGLSVLFQTALPDVADGAPAVLQAVGTASGVVDLVFVTTRAGHIIALNARTGLTVWSRPHGPGPCRTNAGSTPCYTTASPALDPNRQFVYAYGLDGYAHKHRVGDGAEITGGGWPALATSKPQDEKGSSALSVATAADGTSYLYVSHAGYPGDAGDYQGHLTTINLATGAQHVFNMLCSAQTVHFAAAPRSPDCGETHGAIWARPGVVFDPQTGRIYLATGNGAFDGVQDWGNSVVALHPDGTGGANGGPLDSYTPTNYVALDAGDLDVGSTAPALVPTPAGSVVTHLAVQGGKDGMLRLLDLDNLSGQGSPGHIGGEVGPAIPLPQGGEVLSSPAVWVNPRDGRIWVFVTTDQGIAGLRLTSGAGGLPVLQPVWQKGGTSDASPLVANGVLFHADGARVIAYDPTNGDVLGQTPAVLGGFHWESPVVANG
ncbi:MAG: hypothetical protein M3008_01540, partial [Chloroflexota bacterium]|nr:hypothetical protein [Chloroflexota bacterium]